MLKTEKRIKHYFALYGIYIFLKTIKIIAFT